MAVLFDRSLPLLIALAHIICTNICYNLPSFVIINCNNAHLPDPIDGITSVNPEGLTSATGIHSQAFADRLGALGLKCNVVNAQEYRPAMFEKLM